MAPNLNYDKDADVPVVTTEVANDDKETDFDEETPTKEVDLRTKPFIFIVCTAAALGGLIFGYDIGGAGTKFTRVLGSFHSPSTASFLTTYLESLLFRWNFCHGWFPPTF